MSTQAVMDAVDDLLTERPELDKSVAFRRLRCAVADDIRDHSPHDRHHGTMEMQVWARSYGASP